MEILKSNVNIADNFIKSFWVKPEKFFINIKHINFLKLASSRNIAVKKGYLPSEAKIYVPATIVYNGNTTKVKIRLKGTLPDHWIDDEKWSFRIKVKGQKKLLGMKFFSIQKPAVRNFIHEWIYHQILRKEQLISLRYKFIKVILNGKSLGVYALEEHFDKELLENNMRREGPILYFEIDDEAAVGYMNGRYRWGVYRLNKIQSSPGLHSQYICAVNLLEAFRVGKLKASEVFDITQLSRYFALTDLMGARHAAEWHNIRFYFNPISSRLEPIGYDAEILMHHKNSPYDLVGGWKYYDKLKDPDKLPIISSEYYQCKIFNDPVFFRQYIKELKRVSEKSYLDNFFAEIEEPLKENFYLIFRNYPQKVFNKNYFYANQEKIRKALSPLNALYVHFSKKKDNYVSFKIENRSPMPIEVYDIIYKDSFLFKRKEKTIFPAKHPASKVKYKIVTFILPQNLNWSDSMINNLKVNYSVLGANIPHQVSVLPYSHIYGYNLERDFIRQKPNLSDFDFLLIDKKAKQIKFRAGKCNLNQNLVIPEGYTVICEKKTSINLSNSAKILSYSPIKFIGSEDEPIYIGSSDSTGQGIIIMKANGRTLFKHVIFDNLSNPSQGEWELTGATTIYKSPVSISNCVFSNNNRGDDCLNIIRSEFKIHNTTFCNTYYDALDIDFSNGEISKCSFINSGNDAVDSSGSMFQVSYIVISKTGDKGLSVGERSVISVNQIQIKNAEIAVVSKDNSEISINNIDIQNCRIGYAVFEKKPEFGPADIKVFNNKIVGVEIPYLVEKKSSLAIDGRSIEANRKDLKSLLYGVKDGKSSQ
jgi:hypothetical protein